MKNAPVKSFDVIGAAQFLSEQLGSQISPRSFGRLPIPYKVILKRRIFDEPDLVEFIAEQRANAPRRVGGVGQ